MLILFMHHIDCYFLYIFVQTCSLPLVFVFLVFFFVFLFFSVSFVSILLILSIMVRKTRAHRTSTSTSSPTFDSERFLSEKNQEAYEKLNLHRNVWVERKVLLDELDGEIQRNFEHRGWLPLLDISHPPPAALIREFYSNPSIHSYDSNTLVRSWIRGDEYTITPTVVADALGVPLV